ncbi:MAG TPA: bifunctional diguanylate cyclase/phosphodiesterase [Steroidobacteraceae bacterium]|nr:bifunctional diguanylate cyclase/phosphodiesterase [Steroidobacteraceae bacterium]
MLATWVSVFTYLRGNAVSVATEGFVERELPSVATLFELKLAVIAEEPILYDYYATRDRAHFRASLAANSKRIDQILTQLKRNGVNPLLISAIEEHFARLNHSAEDLDKLIGSRRADANRANRLLASISEDAAKINLDVDRALASVSGEVDKSGNAIRQQVAAIVGMVVAFSVAAVVLLVLAGYALRAYLGESSLRRRLALFPERNPHPILTASAEGKVVYANRGALKMLAECGRTAQDLPSLVPADLAQRLRALSRSGLKTDRFEYQVWERDLSCEVHPLPDDDLFYLYLSDVTEQKRAQQRLVHQAYHDPVTGLPNRHKFQEMLAEAMRSAATGAVLVLMVDRFRLLIDSFGHSAGDTVLKAVADRLAQTLREQASESRTTHLFRMDGARFAVLVCGGGSTVMLDAIVNSIQRSTVQPVAVCSRELLISFSIGGSLFPLDGKDAGTVARGADRAMQSVRDQGGNGFRCYGSDLEAEHLERLELETALRFALERGELALHYQPQVTTKTGALVGFEALLRWHHAKLGAISPQRFVPLAEETGLIAPIGEWVLHTACVQARAWLDAGLQAFSVGVNISPRQFASGDLPRTVRRIVQDIGLDPRHLELEVTESVAMQDAERTVDTFKALKGLGVRLAIDDFGTGYSSLSYLKRFPVHRLKIDQSFVRNAPDDPADAAIVRAVILLARNLGLDVIAEGVETEPQRALLSRYGCREIQGYLVARPAPASGLASFIEGCKTAVDLDEATRLRRLRVV